MQDWMYILVYALVAGLYAVLHQLFFRYRFKDLAFTFFYLTLVSLVVMFATKFHTVFTWITVINIIFCFLIGVYIMICLRMARNKLRNQIQIGGLEEMLKNIMGGGFPGGDDIFKNGKESGEEQDPKIIVTEIKSPEDGKEQDDAKYYDVGNVIIDDEKKEEKSDDEEK